MTLPEFREISPFHQCAKCGCIGRPQVKYRNITRAWPPKDSINDETWPDEWLDITCPRCGYGWQTQCRYTPPPQR